MDAPPAVLARCRGDRDNPTRSRIVDAFQREPDADRPGGRAVVARPPSAPSFAEPRLADARFEEAPAAAQLEGRRSEGPLHERSKPVAQSTTRFAPLGSETAVP